MDKEDMVYIYYGILAIKKKEIILFAATWVQLLSKSDRERQIPYYITYMWNPKK